MYSEQTIAQIHSALQALDSSALVLLGGSYLYGEAEEESDVDFYFIIPTWKLFFLKNLKKQIKNLKKEFVGVDFSVMIVPKWFRKRQYYIYGRDVSGKIYTWALPTSTLIRNCIKLAYFNYLRSIVEVENKERNIKKVKKQLGVAKIATGGKINFNEPIFSWEYISGNLPTSHILLEGGDDWSIQQALSQAYHQFLPYLTFSWSNYLLYNIRFLFKGNLLFLFKNPDKIIIKRLKEGFNKNDDSASLYREIKEIIFLVVIF